jgi:hypothetical protein
MTREFPSDETGDVLRNMSAHGVDFSKEHEIEFFLTFDDVGSAKQCAQAIDALRRYQTQLASNDETGRIDVIATRRMFLDHNKITQSERELADLAHIHGGWPDGWGTLQD